MEGVAAALKRSSDREQERNSEDQIKVLEVVSDPKRMVAINRATEKTKDDFEKKLVAGKISSSEIERYEKVGKALLANESPPKEEPAKDKKDAEDDQPKGEGDLTDKGKEDTQEDQKKSTIFKDPFSGHDVDVGDPLWVKAMTPFFDENSAYNNPRQEGHKEAMKDFQDTMIKLQPIAAKETEPINIYIEPDRTKPVFLKSSNSAEVLQTARTVSSIF